MTFNEAISAVINESGNPYAVSYAKALPLAAQQYGERGIKYQIGYILSNLGGWRGERARQAKTALKERAK